MAERRFSGKNFVFPQAFDELLWRGGIRTAEAARLLNRTERTVRDWRAGHRPVPRWAFRLVELTLLDRWEAWGVLPLAWTYPDLRFYLPELAGNDADAPAEDPETVPSATDDPVALRGKTDLASVSCPCIKSRERSTRRALRAHRDARTLPLDIVLGRV